MKYHSRSLTYPYIAFSLVLLFQSIFAQKPVVRAVLFFSPNCPHCHQVINNDLPPLVQKYKDQLDIVGIDVTQEVGNNLYQSAVASFNIPDDRLGVPTLIVGDTVLVGSFEIPQKFPAIIEKGLASGGIDWPDIPGLQEVLSSQPQASVNTPYPPEAYPPGYPELRQPTFITQFKQDFLANSIAVVVLIGMVISAIVAGAVFISSREIKLIEFPEWLLPLLAILGLGIASYLAYIEITETSAVCGPVGNCNSVQQSPYARLFGTIPVGVLGIVGYLAILASRILERYGPSNWRKFSSVAIWGLAWFGVLFSIYLTFLEPFVIGATCMWCLTSAVIMTLILLSTTERAKYAMQSEESAVEVNEISEEAETKSEAEEEKY